MNKDMQLELPVVRDPDLAWELPHKMTLLSLQGTGDLLVTTSGPVVCLRTRHRDTDLRDMTPSCELLGTVPLFPLPPGRGEHILSSGGLDSLSLLFPSSLTESLHS